MKNFYVILIVVSVVAGLALGYGIWGKDKDNLEKLQKILEEKEIASSRALAESEELRNISEELRGKISELETDNNEFKDILKKIDELIGSKIERAAALPAQSSSMREPVDAAPAEKAVSTESVPAAEPAPEVKAAPADAAPADAVPANAVPANAVPANAVPANAVPAEPKAAPVVESASTPDAAQESAAPSIEPAHKGLPEADAGPVAMPAAPESGVSPGLEGLSEIEAGGEEKTEKTEEAPTLNPVPELKSEHPQVEKAI